MVNHKKKYCIERNKVAYLMAIFVKMDDFSSFMQKKMACYVEKPKSKLETVWLLAWNSVSFRVAVQREATSYWHFSVIVLTTLKIKFVFYCGRKSH